MRIITEFELEHPESRMRSLVIGYKGGNLSIMKMRLSSRNHKIIIIMGIAAGLALVAAYYYFFMFRQISPSYAQKECEGLFLDAKAQVAAVPGYTIVAAGKDCRGKNYGLDGTEYSLRARFRVAKNPVNTSSAIEGRTNSISEIKSNINYLIAELPPKDHWLWWETRKDFVLRVVNEPSINGQPVTYCITTLRALSSNGMYIEVDPSNNRTGYVEPGSIPGYDPCKTLYR